MADILVSHLKVKAAEHSALRSLYSQWDFDEKLIPKALQTIGVLFPHYSRHDESHSRQILINIERLLGENVKLLSATDTWLILEAAYWHDVGMVVPQQDLMDAVADPDFSDYIDSICANSGHELNSFACAFRGKGEASIIFESSAPLDMLTKFREFMAEWFRRKHPARAEMIVRSPVGTVGINSPRTELIPSRLFKLLGRICYMHGSPFSDLMGTNGLPFREAGLAQEDCHPRFVACLLRMGDLLDLDDNRFCPIMQRIAGEDRSHTSKAHEDKHAGIRHLRIDQEKIEVSAECESVEGYLESYRWFDWLRQELHDQMANWRDIVPSRELGLLPMLGPVSVRLKGDLQILKDGERPSFSIDAKKAIELLQGENLYESSFAFVRELLQNAVDATLLKVWLTRKVGKEGEWEHPQATHAKTALESSRIYTTIEEADDACSDRNKSAWIFTVRDEGTGISRSDLEYMLKIGGSQGNIERQKKISEMPEWMKPSGNFGIGLQSVFMWSNEISVRTKSLLTNEIYELTLYSPLGPQSGLVVLRQLPNDLLVPYGTEVKVKFELDNNAKHWYISRGDEGSIVSRLVKNSDPVLDEKFHFRAAVLADKVVAFSRYSLIPIEGFLVASNSRIELRRKSDNSLARPWRYMSLDGVEGWFWYEPAAPQNFSDECETFYRGQKFDSVHIYLEGVRFGINILSGKASDWLNFSRDKASARGRARLAEVVRLFLEEAVKSDIFEGKNRNDVEWGINCSVFLKCMASRYGGRWRELANSIGDIWLDFEPGNGKSALRDYFQLSEWEIVSSEYLKLSETSLYLADTRYSAILSFVLEEWQSKSGRTIGLRGGDVKNDSGSGKSSREVKPSARDGWYKLRYNLVSCDQALWDEAALAVALANTLRHASSNMRYLLPVFDDFRELALKENLDLAASNLFGNLPWSGDFILLPHLFVFSGGSNLVEVQASKGQLELLAKWTKLNMKVELPLESIFARYVELVRYIDEEVMAGTVLEEQWLVARCNLNIN